MVAITDLYDLQHTLAGTYLQQFTYPWEALAGIGEMILALGPKLGKEYTQISDRVWVHATATVAPTACLDAPCIIGAHTQVRHGAFIRGAVLVSRQRLSVFFRLL